MYNATQDSDVSLTLYDPEGGGGGGGVLKAQKKLSFML